MMVEHQPSLAGRCGTTAEYECGSAANEHVRERNLSRGVNMERRVRSLIVTVLTVLLAVPVAATQTGCVNALAGMLYVFKGNNIDAEFNGLRGKKVAVVCRPVVQLQYATGNVSGDIARSIGYLLKKNLGKRVTIIDPDRVAEWTDEHTWEEFTEIGEALEADLVLAIELQDFRLYQGQTLYQGRARGAVKIYDMNNDGEVVFQKSLPQYVYPPNTGIPTSDKTEEDFRRQFVFTLADAIGRCFYSHDASIDFARDAAAFR